MGERPIPCTGAARVHVSGLQSMVAHALDVGLPLALASHVMASATATHGDQSHARRFVDVLLAASSFDAPGVSAESAAR